MCAVCGAEFGDHGFETVCFEPSCDAGEIAGCGLGADGVAAGEVNVEVFVNVKCCGSLVRVKDFSI